MSKLSLNTGFRALKASIALICLIAIIACGQKGPLKLPEKQVPEKSALNTNKVSVAQMP